MWAVLAAAAMFYSQPQNEISVCVAGLVAESRVACSDTLSSCLALPVKGLSLQLAAGHSSRGMNNTSKLTPQITGCWAKPLLLPQAVFFPFSQLLPVVYCLLALRPSLMEEIQGGFGVGVFLKAEFRRSRLSAFMESCSSRDEGRQQGCRAGTAVSSAQAQLPSSCSYQLYFKLPAALAPLPVFCLFSAQSVFLVLLH